jgi:hypothetical protein
VILHNLIHHPCSSGLRHKQRPGWWDDRVLSPFTVHAPILGTVTRLRSQFMLPYRHSTPYSALSITSYVRIETSFFTLLPVPGYLIFLFLSHHIGPPNSYALVGPLPSYWTPNSYTLPTNQQTSKPPWGFSTVSNSPGFRPPWSHPPHLKPRHILPGTAQQRAAAATRHSNCVKPISDIAASFGCIFGVANTNGPAGAHRLHISTSIFMIGNRRHT